ncbi:acyl-CoA dehydrogenase family protein [Amycolatopsis anabasis]|uniref:acyl-CoA dehydrogenase family protein n=1 Tax=Amycolatopsis anabasis TaxID=1840409 RepID=UPI00131E3757|nr:acyl-CoA dehydrogenase family protein [Amycolatopsis anabasis]
MNLYETDLALREALDREGGAWGAERVRELGEIAGSADAREHSRRAEWNGPRLHTHDLEGRRIDEIECDPSWHWLLSTGIEHGVASLPWRENRPGAHAVRVALGHLWGQLDTGVMCPLIMTFAAVPVLRKYGGEAAAEWIDRLTTGALAGQAYTEKQGGSDLRRTTTRAIPLADGDFELHGHKWFVSAPMCDVFLTLAQTDRGLSCFLAERQAGLEIVRLKEKLGTRSLPTAEVELRGVRARLIGEEGRGMAPLLENVNHARLGPAVAPEMRAALVRALHHARHRTAFGAALAEQPAMRNVLADLALDSEAATATALRLARAYQDYDSPFRRLATTVNEFWGCGRVTGFVAEALQCLGGNGYSEQSGMPRLLRDAAVHPIWEGSGNVIALDVLRAMAREPEAVEAFVAECELARGGDHTLDRHLDRLKRTLKTVAEDGDPQFLARRVAEDLAVGFQASLLVRHAPAFVADAYCAGRLGEDRGRGYGTLPSGIAADAILERALPS